MKWIPPKSPHGLLQEQLYNDPWKIFVCCIFCNLTKRKQAEPYFWEVLKRWPNAKALSSANKNKLIELIHPLGLSNKRATALIKMSHDYLNVNWKQKPDNLYGIGKYGSDAYKIFCEGSWRKVKPKDGALVNYHNYLKELYNA
jgi:methyl-CpG-binding domain protein 4